MSFLSGFVRTEERPSHSQNKHNKAKSPILSSAIYKGAYLSGIILLLLMITQLMITLLLPVSKAASMFDVYSRNSSSIIGLALIAIFLILWCHYNAAVTKSDLSVRLFKCVAVAAAIVCGVKGLLSIYYTVTQSSRGIYVTAYYAGDILAWLTVSAFVVAFLFVKVSKKESSSSLRLLRCLTIFLAVVCLMKSVTAGLYTMINYVPRVFPWVYYLADTIAWLLLCPFFAAYSRSRLIGRSSVQKVRERDAALDEKIEAAARANKDTEHHYRDHSSRRRIRLQYPDE